MVFIYLLLGMSAVMHIVGCRRIKRQPFSQLKDVPCVLAYEQVDEADLIDIPLPMACHAYRHTSAQVSAGDPVGITYILRYHTTYTVPALVTFYQYEMERLGWIPWSSLEIPEDDQLLIYKKARRSCAILVQASGNVVIWLAQRHKHGAARSRFAQSMAEPRDIARALHED